MKRVADMTREELEREALTDPLTGSWNRRAFDEDEAQAPASIYAAIDMEGLKWINDGLGHAAGDALLKAAASALRSYAIVFNAVKVYRIGGDEFVARIGPIQNEDLVTEWLERLVSELPLIYYGIGHSLAEADAHLSSGRREREADGKRARRGERPRNLARVVEQEVG
jgi:GGDEF domain-containing protein